MEVPRDGALEAKVLAVRQLYDARMTEIAENLQRAPANVHFCKTCTLINKWPIAVSEMSAVEYQRHMRDDLNEALGLLAHNWDPWHTERGFPDANISAAQSWFCTIDTRTKCHACGLAFDLVHVFDSSGDDTFPEEQKAAADEHRAFCPIREVDGWRTDVTQTYHVGDYWDGFVDATNRGDDIMSLVGEDNYDEFIQPRLSRGRVATSRRYFNRKALAAQVLLKHCPKCLRASSTALMGKGMHERVCQLTRLDWVTLTEVQPFRTQEGVDGREMVMNSNGLLERRFRVFAQREKARLERKYQLQLYTRLNLDDRSLTLLGDDNDSEDAPSDQDDRLIPRRRGPPRRRPHRNPINDENSDDENDYGPGRSGGRVAHRHMPTLEEYNSWHAAMAPIMLSGNNNSTEQISSRFPMEFQEMLHRNDPIAAGVPAPRTGPPPTIRPLLEQKAHPSTEETPRAELAPDTGEATTGRARVKIAPPRADPQPPTPDPTRPDDARGGGGPVDDESAHDAAGSVGTGPPLGTNIAALTEADTERPLDVNPTPALQSVYDQMPEAFISAVTESGLLDDPIAFSEKVSTLRLLRPAWDAQNARAAGKAAKRGKRGKREAAGPDTHTALEMYTDFFTSGGLTNAPTPVSFLDILRYPNTRLESDHSYIQFLFPTDSTSSYNPSAPPLPAGFRHALMTTPGFGECCIMGVRRMMVFWGFQHRGTSSTGRPLWRLAPNFTAEHHGWTRRVDHNHLRINRAIRFMRLVGGDRIARAVYRCVMAAIRERNLPVNKRSRRLWRRAALGPMSMDPLAKNFPPDANFWTDSDLDEDEVIVVPRPDLNDSDDDDQEGPEGGADPLLVAGPETFTPGSHPASQATEQSGSKRPSDSTDDDGWHKRQRLQPAWGVPTDSLESSPGFDWDREMHLFKTLRRAGHAEDRPAHHDNGGPEEDLYAADYSSSSEGFLDPHERDEDFIPKRLPFSPIGPMTQSQDIQQTAESKKQNPFIPRSKARRERIRPA